MLRIRRHINIQLPNKTDAIEIDSRKRSYYLYLTIPYNSIPNKTTKYINANIAASD